MAINVATAMNIGALNQCKVVAGSKGMDKKIEYVTIMEVPDVINWLKGGDILLTSLYPIKDDEEALRNLVAELNKKGSSGLAIKTSRYFEQIPEVILAEGNRLNFPIIEVEKNIPYLDIITPLMTKILEKASPERDDIEELFNWVCELAMEGKGLNSIVDALKKILENLITLESEIPVMKVYSEYDLEPLSNEQKSQLKKMKRPMRMTRVLEHKEVSCITVPLILNRELQGYITCWETKRSFLKKDYVFLERVIPLLALEFLKVKAKIEVEQKYRNEFLFEFLTGKLNNTEEIVEKAKIYKWDLLKDYQVFTLTIDQFSEIEKSLDNNEILIQEYKGKLLRTIETIIPYKASIVGSWSDCFTILIRKERLLNNSHGEIKHKNKSTAFILNIIDRIKDDFPTITFTCGIGRFYKGLRGIQLSYKNALQSIQLGREVWGENNVIHFEDLGIYRLLCPFKNVDELKDLYQETVGKLVEYDKIHNGNLTKTVSEYFKNDCGLKETAKEMFIHINTLKYRLQKIEQLTGYNIRTSEGRLHIHLGLKFHNIIRFL